MIPIFIIMLLLISSASALDISVNVSAEGNGYQISEEESWSCIVTYQPASSVPEMALSVTGPAEMYWGIPVNLTANLTNIGKCNLENISAGLEGEGKSDYEGIIEPGDSAEIEIPVVVTGTMATEILRPTADGYLNELESYPEGDHYACVDEAVVNYDDYVEVAIGSVWDFFELANPTNIQAGDTINNVTVCAVVDMGNAADPELPDLGKLGVYVGSTRYESTSFDIDRDQDELVQRSWATNPATSAAWTLSDIQSLQAGVYGENEGSYYLRFVQVYVVVDYTAASTGSPMYAYLQQ